MSLGDNFSIHHKTEHAQRGTEIGAVLRFFRQDTTPPKVKFSIVVGLTEDGISLASVYINSGVNMVVNYSQELRALHLPLLTEDCDFLHHDSFVDCSRLEIKERKDIHKILLSDPEAFVGTLTPAQLTTIRNQIRNAVTIRGKIKKKFGFYDQSI